MNIIKTLSAYILAPALLLSFPAPGGAAYAAANASGTRGAAFSDVSPTDWHYPYIEALAEKKLALGNPDGTFAPDAPLLVDEFLAFTLRTLGHEIPNADGYWARSYIDKALSAGIIEDGEFERCDVPVTRGQIAAIVVRASAEYEGLTGYEAFHNTFSDLEGVKSRGADRYAYILMAIELGVLAGYEDRTFRPENSATRAEASVIVLRMIDESFRINFYGGITFCPKTDINDLGRMKYEKASEYVLKFVSTMKIYASPDGKAVFSGDIPELPPGHNFFYDISFFNDRGRYLSYHTTAAIYEEQYIPPTGGHVVKTKAGVNDVGHITISMTVSTGDSPLNFQKADAQYTIFKYYHKTNYDPYGFFAVLDRVSGTRYFDFGLTEGMWGW